MSIEAIIALVGAGTAMIIALNSLWATRNSATKQELVSLRETIELLQVENKRLQDRVKELEQRNAAQDAAAVCMQDKVRLLDTENLAMSRQIKTLENEKSQLVIKVDSLERDNQTLRMRVAELERAK